MRWLKLAAVLALPLAIPLAGILLLTIIKHL